MAKPPSSTAKNRKPAIAADPAPDPAAEPPVAFDAEGLKRVQDIIKNARATWFALLGALVFASITLASVKDVSFFVNTVETKLPLVGISVPVTSFFWAGSLLIAAIYAYFHLYLELLWQALGDFQARDKDKVRLADRIEPWIVADAALRVRDWLREEKEETGASRPRAMTWISGFVAFGLVWLFGLVVIFWFWWRYMPAHDAQQTIFLGLVLTVTYFVFATSLASAWSHLKFPNGETRRTAHWQWTVPLVFVAVVGTTLVRTGRPPEVGTYESMRNPLLFGQTVCGWQRVIEKAPPPLSCWRRSDLYDVALFPAPANLREVVFTEKPKDWQGKEIAETEFRVRWCRERGETKCVNPLDPAKRLFEREAERAFQAAWKERWQAQLTSFVKPDLRGKDFRGADIAHAEMEGVDLRGARLEGADLKGARLEGALLSGASLQGADLEDANLDQAILVSADLDRANLQQASLRRANLASASLVDAYLALTHFEGAYLGSANFEGAKLHGATLFGSPELLLDMSDVNINFTDLAQNELIFIDF
jgi:uncharacterized protein YjbI with pentapeptide repeats